MENKCLLLLVAVGLIGALAISIVHMSQTSNYSAEMVQNKDFVFSKSAAPK